MNFGLRPDGSHKGSHKDPHELRAPAGTAGRAALPGRLAPVFFCVCLIVQSPFAGGWLLILCSCLRHGSAGRLFQAPRFPRKNDARCALTAVSHRDRSEEFLRALEAPVKQRRKQAAVALCAIYACVQLRYVPKRDAGTRLDPSREAWERLILSIGRPVRHLKPAS